MENINKMEKINFFLMDYTLHIVATGACLLGLTSGVLGSFAVLRKQSLLGDAISHSALPGIILAFMITQTKNTEILLLGALVTGLMATGIILIIQKYSRIKFDSALGLVLSVFFGAGLILLSYIQKIPNANQAGLDKFIFGQAATILYRDVQLMVIIGSLLIALVIIFWKELKIVSFDPEFAQSIGISVKKITLLLSSMIVISIIMGLQMVGVILMSAMLIAPGVAARQWTDKLAIMVILSSIFGALSGIIGTIISSSITKMPTGPSIVVVVSIIVFLSLAFAPNRGLLWKAIKKAKNVKNINEDQVLIELYYLAMNHKNKYHSHSVNMIRPVKKRGDNEYRVIVAYLKKLQEKKYVKADYFSCWAITEEGISYVNKHPMKEVQ